MINVDIISDVVCPWCVIGYKRLEAAIAEMGIQKEVELKWHPFELNPDMPAEGEDLADHLGRKYGTTSEENTQVLSAMKTHGDELGFHFDFFDGMKMVNTRDAHVLIDYAVAFGKQTELQVRLFEAFFSERKDVSHREILIGELQRIGLPDDEALKKLDYESARDRIRSREDDWLGKKVLSVPTMVIERSKTLIGAQTVEFYKKELTDLKER